MNAPNPLRSLSPRDRRALTVGGALVVGLVVATRGAPAWRAWDAQQRAAAAELISERARAVAALRAHAQVRDSARARAVRLSEVAFGIVRGRTPAVAAAILGSILTEAAGDAGVRLGAVQVSADTAGAGWYLRVRAKAEGTGDVQGVSALLERLEAGQERLAVREFAVTQSEPGAGPERPEALRVSLTVEGLARHLAVDAGPQPAPAGAPRAARGEVARR